MKKTFIISLITLIILGVAYSAGIGYYAEKFQANTTFGSVDISNLTLQEAQAKIEEELNNETITIKENGQTLGTFTVSELNGQLNTEEVLTSTYNSQNPTEWLGGYFSSVEYDHALMDNLEINDEDLTAVLAEIGLTNSDREAATNAYIDYQDGRGYFVQDASNGTQLDLDEVKELIVTGLQDGTEEVEINQTYLEPEVTAESEEIQSLMNRIEELTSTKITLDIAGNQVTIPQEKIEEWLYFDSENNPVFDQNLIYEYLGTLNDQYATYNSYRSFNSTLQGEVTVDPGTLGWSIYRDEEAAQIAADLLAGEDITRQPIIQGTGYNSNGDDIGGTYVEVDLTNQMMYYYRDGVKMLETAIVSGMGNNHAVPTPTIAGAYSIWNKERDATLVGINQQRGNDYEQPVSYWLPFDDTGQGIHDANWQANFGGDIYQYAGSQGCINTPPGMMAQLFELVEVGTPVIIF